MVLSSTFAISTVAHAQPAPAPATDPSRAAEAERLFHEGRALLAAGDLARACANFTESEKLDPAPGTLLSLADCEERAKTFVKAREHYQLAASGFAKNDARRAFATGRAVGLEKRIAHLTLRLPPDAPAELSVRTGDLVVPRSELGTSNAVDPGDLQIRVSSPGRKDNVITVTLAEGETKDVFCELGAPDTAAVTGDVVGPKPSALGADDREAMASSSDPRRTVSYVLLGVGAASLVVGGVTGVLALSKAGTVKDHCDASYACDQDGVDAASAGRTLSPVSTITLIAGAALAGAGAYFFFTSGKAHKPPPTALLQALQLRGSF